jgi:hypothetical protein
LLHGIHVNSSCCVCNGLWWTKKRNMRYIKTAPMFGCARGVNRLSGEKLSPQVIRSILLYYCICIHAFCDSAETARNRGNAEPHVV